MADVVADYIRYCQPLARDELRHFADRPSLRQTIDLAARCRNSSDKRFSHQRRRSEATLNDARDVLVSESHRLQRCRSFAELHDTVDRLVSHIPDLGPLYSYDTALHIGAKLGLAPDVVYLHSGTRDGARALGLPHRQQTLEVNSLPKPLRKLAPYEIEDCLCIFKDDLNPSMA